MVRFDTAMLYLPAESRSINLQSPPGEILRMFFNRHHVPREQHADAMAGHARRTGMLFIAVVLIPGCILGGLALHTLSKERVLVEKRITTTLSTECTTVAASVRQCFAACRLELDTLYTEQIAADSALAPPVAPLISVPFLLSAKRSIIYPVLSSRTSEADLAFIKYNREFFQDQKTLIQTVRTPVKSTAKTTGPKPSLKAAPAKTASEVTAEYYVFTRFSIDTMESYRFSQCIEGKSSGIIPRVIDDDVLLLYWKRAPANRIAGCMLSENELRRRIAMLLGDEVNDTRTITILDHHRSPMTALPKGDSTAEPFVNIDISDIIPRWSVAAYLPDPRFIIEQSIFNSLVIGILITLLLIALAVGGFLVFRSIDAEMRLARQQTTFVANVSHELKTPLTSIRLFAELMKDGRQKDPEKQRQYLGIMVAETERLTRLINNVLDFSRTYKNSEKKIYTMHRLDMVDLCRTVIDAQRVRLEYGRFTVLFSPAVGTAAVNGDNEALQQALLNLIANSEKYSVDEKRIELSVMVENGSCVIDVSDNGIGINAKHIPYIFDEFYRADMSLSAPVQGTGLGLTITRQIIHDHGGTISYLSKKPYRSTFRITLPLAEENSHETEDTHC